MNGSKNTRDRGVAYRFLKMLMPPGGVNIREQRYYFTAAFAATASFLAHVFFLILFYFIDVYELIYVNIFSLTMFSTAFYLAYFKKKYYISGLVSCVEFFVHQIFCVIYVGWDAGFQFYILFMIILSGMMPPEKMKQNLAISITACAEFLILAFFYSKEIPVYTIDPGLLKYINLVIIFLYLFCYTLGLFYYNLIVKNAEDTADREFERAESLLHNILPVPIAARLKRDSRTIADGFDSVTVLFSDIVDFTKLAASLSAEQVVTLLNQVFSRFDEIAERYGLEKIKTIGDAYMVASGIPERCGDQAERIANFALDMMKEIESISTAGGTLIDIRVGINTGPVVAGVIGKKKFIYDLWGDAVNLASRMESHGIPGKIQVTETTYDLLKNRYRFEDRGMIEVKGKGQVHAYILVGKIG